MRWAASIPGSASFIVLFPPRVARVEAGRIRRLGRMNADQPFGLEPNRLARQPIAPGASIIGLAWHRQSLEELGLPGRADEVLRRSGRAARAPGPRSRDSPFQGNVGRDRRRARGSYRSTQGHRETPPAVFGQGLGLLGPLERLGLAARSEDPFRQLLRTILVVNSLAGEQANLARLARQPRGRPLRRTDRACDGSAGDTL